MKYEHSLSFLFAFLYSELLPGSSVGSGEDALRKQSSTLGWMVGSWRETEIGAKLPEGHNANQSFLFHSARANKRCPLNRPFSGKNSLTRLTRNAVICKAFPAKRFISCPWGKRQPLFFFDSYSESNSSALLLLLIWTQCSPVLSPSLICMYTGVDTTTGTSPAINTTIFMSERFWFP